MVKTRSTSSISTPVKAAPAAKNYGTGFLYSIVCSATGKVEETILKSRCKTPADCSPKSVINTTNLLNSFSVRCSDSVQVPVSHGIGAKLINTSICRKRGKKRSRDEDESDGTPMFPVVVYTIDGEEKHLGVMLFLHPSLSLVASASLADDNSLILYENIVRVLPRQNELFRLKYVNIISQDLVCPDDKYLICSTNGPHRIGSDQLLPCHLREIENAKATMPPLYDINSLNNLSNWDGMNKRTISPTDPTKKSHEQRCLSDPNKVSIKSSIQEGGNSSKAIAIPYATRDGPVDKSSLTHSHTVEIAYIPYSKIDTVLEKIGEKTKHDDFDKVLDDNKTNSQTVKVHYVPNGGIVFEEDNDASSVGNEKIDDSLPQGRDGKTLVEWGMLPKNQKVVSIRGDDFLFMCKRTFGDHTEQRDVARALGINIFHDINTAHRVRPTPTKGPSNITESEKSRQNWDPTFLPIILHMMEKLTRFTNDVSKMLDPVWSEFQVRVFSESDGGESITFMNTPGKHFNHLQLVTGPNEQIRGFANENHTDANDGHGKNFDRVAEHVLSVDFQKCVDVLEQSRSSTAPPNQPSASSSPAAPSSSDAVKSLQTISHLHRLGCPNGGNGNRQFSLRATCAYQTMLDNQPNKRIRAQNKRLRALFLYNDLGKAVSIPANRISYQSWESYRIEHQTCIPYSLGEFCLSLILCLSMIHV